MAATLAFEAMCHMGQYFVASVPTLASNATVDVSISVGPLVVYGAYVIRALVSLKDWLGSKAHYQSVWIPTGLNADGAELFWSESIMTAQDAEGLWDAGVYPLSEGEYTEPAQCNGKPPNDYVAAQEKARTSKRPLLRAMPLQI